MSLCKRNKKKKPSSGFRKRVRQCIHLIYMMYIIIQLYNIKEATKIVGTSYAYQGLKDEVLRQK